MKYKNYIISSFTPKSNNQIVFNKNIIFAKNKKEAINILYEDNDYDKSIISIEKIGKDLANKFEKKFSK